jgi:hypothetical protein
MKKLNKSITILVLLTVAVFVSFMSESYGSTITFNDMSGYHVDYSRDGRNVIAFAGEKDITLDGFSSAAYCVEPGIPHANGSVQLINPSSYDAFSRGWTSQASYNNYYNGMHAAWLMDQYSTGLGYNGYLGDKSVADAGLQIAIWYVLYNFNPNDGSFDDTYFHNWTYRNNNFYFVPSFFSADLSDGANSGSYGDGNKEEAAWLTAYEYYFNFQEKYTDNNLDFSGDYEFFVAKISDENGEYQAHLIARPVPAPSTFILLGTGLLALSSITRRRYYGI